MGEVFITRRGGGFTKLPEPIFTYTGGAYESAIDENTGEWEITFTSSGILTFNNNNPYKYIDVFLVGGGGGNGNTKSVANYSGSGGSGYTTTVLGHQITNNTPYEIVIGTGSSMPSSNNETAVTRGGSSSAFGYVAEGGYSGYRLSGGDGGSGGADAASTVQATNGADGTDAASGTGSSGSGGKGQGTPTTAFGLPTGKLFATGGARGSGSGANNTGDGGGGTTVAGQGTQGGSGVVIIRNSSVSVES